MSQAPMELTPFEKEFLMRTEGIYEQWEREVIDRGRREGREVGREEGREDGVQRTLIAVYESRFGAMPEDLAGIVKRTKALDVLNAWVPAVVTRSAAQIRALLRKAANG